MEIEGEGRLTRAADHRRTSRLRHQRGPVPGQDLSRDAFRDPSVRGAPEQHVHHFAQLRNEPARTASVRPWAPVRSSKPRQGYDMQLTDFGERLSRRAQDGPRRATVHRAGRFQTGGGGRVQAKAGEGAEGASVFHEAARHERAGCAACGRTARAPGLAEHGGRRLPVLHQLRHGLPDLLLLRRGR